MKPPKYPHGKALRIVRSLLGWTQSNAADRARISKRALQSFESGETIPGVESLLRTLEAAGCQVVIKHETLGLEIP